MRPTFTSHATPLRRRPSQSLGFHIQRSRERRVSFSTRWRLRPELWKLNPPCVLSLQLRGHRGQKYPLLGHDVFSKPAARSLRNSWDTCAPRTTMQATCAGAASKYCLSCAGALDVGRWLSLHLVVAYSANSKDRNDGRAGRDRRRGERALERGRRAGEVETLAHQSEAGLQAMGGGGLGAIVSGPGRTIVGQEKQAAGKCGGWAERAPSSGPCRRQSLDRTARREPRAGRQAWGCGSPRRSRPRPIAGEGRDGRPARCDGHRSGARPPAAQLAAVVGARRLRRR